MWYTELVNIDPNEICANHSSYDVFNHLAQPKIGYILEMTGIDLCLKCGSSANANRVIKSLSMNIMDVIRALIGDGFISAEFLIAKDNEMRREFINIVCNMIETTYRGGNILSNAGELNNVLDAYSFSTRIKLMGSPLIKNSYNVPLPSEYERVGY